MGKWQLLAPDRALALRRRVFEILDGSNDGGLAGRLVGAGLVVLILLNVAAFVFGTVPEVEARWGAWLTAFEVVSVGIFTLEYGLRLWTAVEMPFYPGQSPTSIRLAYARQPLQVVDLFAILPAYLAFLLPFDLRVLRILRLLRLLKLARYSPAMHALLKTIVQERRALLGTGLLLLVALLFSATAMYYAERIAQPDKFGSVPDSAYWAMTTLSTVGYGDVTPVTPLGKLVAMLTMFVGLCVLALPIAIISTGFAREVGRRDFVITWSLMSRIPILSDLGADEVAAIEPLLHATDLAPHMDVTRPGEPGEAMFFVASGQIKVQSPEPKTLGRGDFFGEVALLEGGNHTYRRTTLTACRLLKLARQDFMQLERAKPELAARIRDIAHRRLEAREQGKAEPGIET